MSESVTAKPDTDLAQGKGAAEGGTIRGEAHE